MRFNVGGIYVATSDADPDGQLAERTRAAWERILGGHEHGDSCESCCPQP